MSVMHCAVKKINIHVCLFHGHKKGLRTYPVFKKLQEVEAQHFALFGLFVVNGNKFCNQNNRRIKEGKRLTFYCLLFCVF